MHKILIADDDNAIRLLYQEELEDEGYSVTTVSDRRNLMEMIGQRRPDLVLLDVKLGENNGFEILQWIRTVCFDMPIILCSAYPSCRYDIKVIGADYYVTKSVDLSELKLTIKKAFQRMVEDRDIVTPQFLEQHLYEINRGQM
jgi:DNA-binding response OmpR family regulator